MPVIKCQNYVRNDILMKYILLLLLLTSPVHAAFEDQSGGARARSMSGACGAFSGSSENIFASPSGLSGTERPEVSLTYGRIFIGLSDNSQIANSIATAGLPISPKVCAGLGYKKLSLENAYSEETITAAAAFTTHKLFTFGFSAKYLRLGYGADDYTKIDPVFALASTKNGWGVDSSIVINILPPINFSYTRSNVTAPDLGLSERYIPQSVDRFALGYVEDGFRLAVDFLKADTKNTLLSGIEKYLLGKVIAIRAGAGWSDGKITKISTGLGFSLTPARIDYSLEYPLSGIEETSGTHYITITMRAGERRMKQVSQPQRVIAQIETIAVSTVPAVSEIVTVSSATVTKNVSVSTAPIALDDKTAEPVPMYNSLFPFIFQSPAWELIRGATVQSEAQSAAPAPAPAVINKSIEPSEKQAQSASRTHKVVAGDTLPSLSIKYYNDKSAWIKIYEANKDKIEKGSIKPGQILVIP